MAAYIEMSKDYIMMLKRWGDFLYNLDIDDKSTLVKEFKFWENLSVTKPVKGDDDNHMFLRLLTINMNKFSNHISQVLRYMVSSDRIEENISYLHIKEIYIDIVLHIEKINEFINDITKVIELISNLNIDDKNTLVKEYDLWEKLSCAKFGLNQLFHNQIHEIHYHYLTNIVFILYNLIYSDKDYDDVHYKRTKQFIK